MRRPIVVMGDLLLDVIAAPAAPMQTDGDVPAAIRLLPGGQGANLAVRLARCGRTVRLIAALADDAAGAVLRDACATEGVTLEALPAARSGSVVIVVDPHGRRSMLSDRVAGIAPTQVDPDVATVCSCYALLDPTGAELADLLVGRTPGTFLALVGCAVEPSDAAATMLARMRATRPELVICNRDEAAALVGTNDVDLASLAATLGSRLETLALVTDPSHGSVASLAGAGVVPRAVAYGATRDTTGVGDAYAAAVVDALVDGDWPPGPSELAAAMRAGAVLAAQVAGVSGAQTRVALESRPAATGRSP
jgi:ribokinase